jgi:hypothetical protein
MGTIQLSFRRYLSTLRQIKTIKKSFMDITPAGMKSTSADGLKENYSDHSAIKMKKKKNRDIPRDVEPMTDRL